MLLTQLDIKVPGLENLCDLYATDHDFSAPYSMCVGGKTWDKYHIHDGFLFCANKLCVPESFVCLLLLQESHAGGLMGHFGCEKMLLMLANHFYWPRMRRCGQVRQPLHYMQQVEVQTEASRFVYSITCTYYTMGGH
jgi:hypothetical protein